MKNNNSRLRSNITSTKFFTSTLMAVIVAGTSYGTPAMARQGQSVIEEVVVTAQKRQQDLQDVSVAVSAFSGEAIEKMGFEEGLEITQQVPNMNFFAIFGEASSPSVSLRGISLVNFSDSWESPVAIYVDDVYRGNPAGSAIQLFDLKRVEVLRGPQGTLYGRNTTGGLVHYISRKPTDDLEASASMSYGSYNERIAQAMVSGPLVDDIRGRLAVKSTNNDGWQTNTVSGAKLNDTHSFGYRGQLDADLGEHGNVLLNVHGSRANQGSVGFAHMGYLESANANAPTCDTARIQKGECTSATFGFTGAEAVDGHFDPEHVASGAKAGLKTKIDTFGVSAHATWNFDNATLTSITAYEELDKFLQDDGDGTKVIFFDEQYTVDAEQYTQELRLNGTTDNTKWVTGLYYYKDDRGLRTESPTTADALANGGFSHQEIIALNTSSWAVFGQMEYSLTPELTLITGARYTQEQRDFNEHSWPSFYFSSPFDKTDDFSDNALTGRLGLDWRPNDNTLAYVSLSTGFKSGGFSGSYNASQEATKPVDSEDITNAELGYKTSFANGRVKLNTALFRYKITDYQAQVFLTVANGSVITNAGNVTGTGAEAELTAQVSDNFELIAGAGLLHTKFDSDQIFMVAGDEYTLDGNKLPSAPEFTYNLVARYYIPLGDSGEIALQADYNWQAKHYLQIENDPYSLSGSYGIANAKISWQSASERFTLSAFVKNATNEEYFTYQNTLGDDWGYGVWGLPRTAGIKLRWKL